VVSYQTFTIAEKASHKQKRSTDDSVPERELYEMLCRGEVSMSIEETSKLKCRLTTRNNPYFILSPIKEEEAALKPKLLIFHDVMNDVEIATIKKLATPRVNPYTIFLYVCYLIFSLAAVQTGYGAELQDR
jgi:hypothetical protein